MVTNSYNAHTRSGTGAERHPVGIEFLSFSFRVSGMARRILPPWAGGQAARDGWESSSIEACALCALHLDIFLEMAVTPNPSDTQSKNRSVLCTFRRADLPGGLDSGCPLAISRGAAIERR